MMQTKAEQLADECDNFGHGVEPLNISVVARELRRLSPMEAQLAAAKAMHHDEQLHSAQISRGLDKAQARVKELEPLLKINKVLVDALENIKIYGALNGVDVACMASNALKLAGEIK